MASPVVEGRIEPHKKAHFNLHISDQIARGDASTTAYSGFKYNHKPAQTADTRTTTLTSSSAKSYNLRLEDANGAGKKDIFTFTGQKSAPTKSYVLLFDPASQEATLEQLTGTFTFNLATKNNKDVSTQNLKIYPKKIKDGSQDKDDDDDLFGEIVEEDGGDPDSDNPYDFRHFLSKEKEKRGDESEYHFASSPDYRAGTGSAANTPQYGAAAPTAAPASKAKPKVTQAAPKKRKTAASNPLISKARKAQPPPTVRLDRRASERPPVEAAPKTKARGAASSSKIVSSEFVHSSDESDVDADGEAASSPPAPARRSPSPVHHQPSDDDDEDAEGESDDDGDLEIENPDTRPARRGNGALASLGLGQNIGVGFLKSPSNGPISLASATSSVAGSPNLNAFASRKNHNTQDEIDFGDFGGDDAEGEDDDEDEDHNQDIEPMDIGPPARHGTTGHERKASVTGMALEDDEDDLEKMMMAGFAGGDSSEESEEE